MEDNYKNYGVKIGRRDTDYQADRIGGNLPYEVRQPDGNYEPYVPPGEWQRSDRGDNMSCVSFGHLNSIETQMNKLLYEGKIPDETLQFMIDMGYLSKKRP